MATATKTPSRRKKVTKLRNKVAFVLDRSGSMRSLTSSVIQTYNSWLNKIRLEATTNNQETSITQIRFDDVAEVVEFNNDVENVKPMTSFGLGGMTALFDGVTLAIDKLSKFEKDKDTSMLVIVVTDGNENASQRANISNINKLMATKQAKDTWTFVFMLPPGQKNSFCNTYGIPKDNVVEWEASERGLREVEVKTSGGLGNYFNARSRGLKSVDTFYVNSDLSGVTSRQIKRELDDISAECRVLEVKQEEVIQDFVETKTRRPYVKGSAYYQLMKNEIVQPNKEVLIMEKGKRAIYAGPEARALIGLPTGANAKVVPGNHSNYDIFVQSTSTNRKLPRGTKLIVRS